MQDRTKFKDITNDDLILFDNLIAELPININRFPAPLWRIIKEYYATLLIDKIFGDLARDSSNIVCLQEKDAKYSIYYNLESIENGLAVAKIYHLKYVKDLNKVMKIFFKIDRFVSLSDFFNQKYYSLHKLRHINIVHELLWAAKLKDDRKEQILDLYEVFKDFNFPLAVLPAEYENYTLQRYIGDKYEPDQIDRITMMLACVIPFLHAFIINPETSVPLIILDFLFHALNNYIFKNKWRLTFNNIFPNALDEENMPAACKKRLSTTQRLGLIGLSLATETLTQDSFYSKFKVSVNCEHLENGIALDVLMRDTLKFTRSELTVFTGSLLLLGLLQYDKVCEFGQDDSTLKTIAAMTLFPLLSVPRLLVNSHALVQNYKKAKQNPHEFIPSFNDSKWHPRNALGFSSWTNHEYHDKRFVYLFPLMIALSCLLAGDKWWVAAAKIMLSFVNASFMTVPGYKWSPRMYTAPKNTNTNVVVNTASQKIAKR